jgi:hypothetical protein
MRDIFRDGPSPELAARMAKEEAEEAEYFAASEEEREELLKNNPRLRRAVTCEECKRPFDYP